MLFELVTLLMLLFIAGFMLRIFGPASVLTFFSAYNLLCCAVLLYTVNMGLTYSDFKVGNLWFSAMPMVGLEPYVATTLFFYWALTALIVFASFPAPRRRRRSIAEQSDTTRLVLSSLVARLVEKSRIRVGIVLAPLILIPLTVYHLLSLDLGELWRNYDYLTITDPYKMGLTQPILIVYHFLYRIIGLVSGVLVVALAASRKAALAVPYLLLWAYGAVMLLIAGSRFSVIYFLAIALPLFVLSTRAPAKILGAIFIGLSFYALIFSMSARAAGVFGASMLIKNMTSAHISSLGAYFIAAFVNIFEGALNVANSLALAPSFSERYQLLSMSPLASFIDGFESIREVDRYKFAQFVPMGAFGEIINFGIAYQVVFFAVLWLALRYFARLDLRDSPLKYLVMSLLGVYVVYLLPTYSIRTTWRFLVLFGILIPSWNFMNKRIVLRRS